MNMDDSAWADEAREFNEQIEGLIQEDGCAYCESCIDPGCPFEDCLLASDDKWEILGRYCFELTEEGYTNKQIGKKINRSVSSVVRYKKCAKDL